MLNQQMEPVQQQPMEISLSATIFFQVHALLDIPQQLHGQIASLMAALRQMMSHTNSPTELLFALTVFTTTPTHVTSVQQACNALTVVLKWLWIQATTHLSASTTKSFALLESTANLVR